MSTPLLRGIDYRVTPGCCDRSRSEDPTIGGGRDLARGSPARVPEPSACMMAAMSRVEQWGAPERDADGTTQTVCGEPEGSPRIPFQSTAHPPRTRAVGSLWHPRQMSEPTGFRVYSLGQRPDVEVPHRRPLVCSRRAFLVAEPVRLVDQLCWHQTTGETGSAPSTRTTGDQTPWTIRTAEVVSHPEVQPVLAVTWRRCA